MARLASFLQQRTQWQTSLVIATTMQERKRIFDLLVENEEALSFDGEQEDAHDFLMELRTGALLTKKKILVLDQADRLAEKAKKILVSFCTDPAPGTMLLLGTSQKAFSHACNVDLLIDITAEKPWDKAGFFAKRLCAQAGKQFGAGVERVLMQKVGYEIVTVEQEVRKLIAFVGERAAIVESDVMAVCVSSSRKSLYKCVEKIVWEGKPMQAEIEEADAYLFLSLLRTQLELRWRAILLFAQGKDESAIRSELSMDKRIGLQYAEKCSFKETTSALHALFACESAAKKGVLPVELIVPMLSARIFP